MIIVDVETSGLSAARHSLLSIGAVDFETSKEFYTECRLEEGKEVQAEALAVNGFNPLDIVNPSKPTVEEAYKAFYQWVVDNQFVPLLAGQQVGSFDVTFLRAAHDRYTPAAHWIFGHRTVDLHSVAFGRFKESLSLDGILVKLGLAPEPKPHKAINGARLERDAFKKLL